MTGCKATPGPWVVNSTATYIETTAEGLMRGRTSGYGCGNEFICDLNDGEYHEYADDAEQLANAHLIAAAPELYEALEACLGAMTGGLDGVWHEDIDPVEAARAALLKARGES